MAPEETYTYTADSREAATYGCDGSTGTGIDSYYDLSGRLIEVERFSPACGGGLSYTMRSQYVWGLDYVNSLVERDDASTSGDLGVSGSGLGVRLYATHDANYNITATTDDSGAVTERFQYDPYGKQTALNASWGAYSGSSTEPWNVGFQGGVQMYLSVAGGFTTDTGLIQFDNRIYDVDLGRWIQQDPAGYIDGANRYQFAISNPIGKRDPAGLAASTAAEFFGYYNSGISAKSLDAAFSTGTPFEQAANYAQQYWSNTDSKLGITIYGVDHAGQYTFYNDPLQAKDGTGIPSHSLESTFDVIFVAFKICDRYGSVTAKYDETQTIDGKQLPPIKGKDATDAWYIGPLKNPTAGSWNDLLVFVDAPGATALIKPTGGHPATTPIENDVNATVHVVDAKSGDPLASYGYNIKIGIGGAGKAWLH